MAQLAFKTGDIPDGGMRRYRVDDRKILVVREGDAVRAFDARCPHAGADLGEGVLCAGRLVCPWHHGAFDTRDGNLLEPPADAGLTRYALQRTGSGWLLDPRHTQAAAASAPCGAYEHTVIVGAGAAGYMAAQTLRMQGYAGQISLIDPDPAAPYDRTMLSKQFLAGEAQPGDTAIGGEDWARRQRLNVHRTRASAIDHAHKQVELDDGATLSYTHLIVATGSVPVDGGLPGAQLEGVHVLRSLADAQALRAAAQGRRLAIVGTSFIALEAATPAGRHGAAGVTVIGREPEILGKMVSARVGRELRRAHEAKGVRFELGIGIEALAGEGAVSGVRLQDGRTVDAEVVLLGTGVRPCTGLLKDFAQADGSLYVDAHMRIAPDIYAIGDIATAPSASGRLRVEHWRVAQQQGMVAAQSIIQRHLQPMDRRVPFVWTLQQEHNLRYVGHAGSTADTHVWGDPAQFDFIEFIFEKGRAVAASGLQRDTELAAFEELLRHGHRLDAATIRAGEFSLLERLEQACR